MANSPGHSAAAHTQDVIELRLLMELAAVRELASRGLRNQELAAMRRLADASTRFARCHDARGYLDADRAFHMYLLGLTGDPALLRVAELLLPRSLEQRLRGKDSGRLMSAGASDHAELVRLLADELAGSAGDLLRQHVAPTGCWSVRASAGVDGPESIDEDPTWPIE